MPDRQAPRVRKGRGAVGNPAGRFERHEIVPFDDGWGTIEREPSRLRTEVTPERTRKILTTNDSPDVPFSRSINPYKGCEHGCSYCFARQTHAYLGLSPGLDFETRIFSKPDGAALLRRELRKPGYRCEPIALGANTDPYQPVERGLGLTRELLEVLAEHRHPFTLVTKSNLVLRDLDLLAPLAADNLVAVFVSITTLDLQLARTMEPRAPTPRRRIDAVRGLAEAGVPVGVLTSPMILGLNDHELDNLLEAAAEAGARRANYILLRLPHDVRDVFVEWLETHYPSRAARVLNLLRDARGGKLYEPRFGERMRGRGRYAELLERRFELACGRLGLTRERDVALDTAHFCPPGRQGSLF